MTDSDARYVPGEPVCLAGASGRRLGLAPPARGVASARVNLRLLAETLLCEATGARQVARLCPTCGSSAHGQPRLIGSGLHASISYAAGLVAVAWGEGPVGIDIERSSSGRFSPPNRANPPLDGGDLVEWTRLEALAKAAGTGLRDWPRIVPPELPTRALREVDGLPTGYVGTVADATGHARVHLARLSDDPVSAADPAAPYV